MLIDGDELARLVIAHGVGVTPVAVYEVKRVDSDYFSEEVASSVDSTRTRIGRSPSGPPHSRP